MQPIWANLAALTVVALYYLWRNLDRAQRRREQALREGVASMLWALAERGDRPSGYRYRTGEN